MKDPSLFEAFQNWEELSMEQKQRLAYESRLKRIMDEEAAKREAELRIEEAKQEARQEAEQNVKVSIARQLLEKGMEIEFVADSTGLTRDKVIAIQSESQD